MTDYGIFVPDGFADGPFASREEAEAKRAKLYGDDPEVYVAEVCPDHPEYERGSCPECDGDAG